MNRTRLRRSGPERERYWRDVMQGQGQSGQSVRAYCREAGVKESAFYWWRRELARRSKSRKIAGSGGGKIAKPQPPRGRKPARSSAGDGRVGGSKGRGRLRRDKPGAETPVGGGLCGNNASPFVPIRVLDAPAGIEIHLGDGRMIFVRPGFDRQTFREVLAALEGGPC